MYSRATDHQHVQAWSRRVRETAGNKKLNEEVYGTQPTDNELMLHTSGGSAEGDSTMGAFQKLEDGDLIAWKSTDINPLTVSTNKSSKSASASHILASNGVGIGKKSARTAAGIKGDNNENDENNNSINIHDKISANAGATPVSATSSPAAKKKTQKSMRAFGRKKTQRKTADQIINEIVVKERAKKAKTYIPPQRKWKEKPGTEVVQYVRTCTGVAMFSG